MFDAVYVINLDRAADRWEAVQQVIALAGFSNPIRIPAIDGATLDDDALACLQQNGSLAMTLHEFNPACDRAEIGCGLSHARALQDMLDRGRRTALILEDDVQLTGSPNDWRARCAAALADLPADWELWYLHRCFDVRHRVRRLSPRTVVPYLPQSGAAYAVTAAGARTLLNALRPLSCAVDRTYMELVRTGRVAAFAASPMLLDPAGSGFRSTIRQNALESPWTIDGVNRPPEYWPPRYLAAIGEPQPIVTTLSQWSYRAGALLRRIWPRA